jgi:hypothetical protein
MCLRETFLGRSRTIWILSFFCIECDVGLAHIVLEKDSAPHQREKTSAFLKGRVGEGQRESLGGDISMKCFAHEFWWGGRGVPILMGFFLAKVAL